MNTILAWFKSKSISTHSFAVVAILIAGLITGDPQVRDFVTALFQAHPTLGADIVLLAALIAKYTQSSSPAGTIATARQIIAAPDTPTQKEVDAADTKAQ